MKIDILYQFNEKYAPYAGVSMTSLFENNRHFDEIRVFILGEGLEEKSIGKFHQLSKQYHRSILFINTDSLLENMREMGLPTYRGSYAANMRLFLSGLLEESVNRLLYLDADTIIDGPLDGLVTLEMGTYPLAMAMDSLVRKHKKRLGFKKEDYYYNSGVILFQMKEWEKRKCSERIMEHIKNVRAHYPSPDQDLLNVVCNNEIFTLHPRYNMQPIHLAFSLSSYYLHFCRTGYYPVNVVREAIENPVIYHFFRFVGEFPWDKDNLHPDKEVFAAYLEKSLWNEYEMKKADTQMILKIEKILYSILPKNLFIVLFEQAYEFFIWKANSDSLKKIINKSM